MRNLLLTLAALLIGLPTFSQCDYKENVPKELVRERYTPADSWYGNPYTMFNKRKKGWTLEGDLTTIRNLIKTQVRNGDAYGYAAIYKAIFNAAKASEPAKCYYDQQCPHAAWVKNNSIVYLIGLVHDTTPAGVDIFTYLPETDPGRSQYATRADNGLRNLNPRMKACYGLFGACDVVKGKAFDLIHYLQAYDMLKTAKYYPPGDGDRNKGDCSARNKLREYSRNMYIQAEDIINNFTGWKRNHGIIAASSLGLASIVLNDAGVETSYIGGLFGFLSGEGIVIAHPKYSPGKWQQRADGNGGYNIFDGEDGLEDLFFHGDHMIGFPDVPQTNSTGTAGYAEGPGYAHYIFEALLPYMRAYANYRSPATKVYVNDPRYQEILNWYQNISMPSGQTPSYDNSGGQTNPLGILGEPAWPSTSAPLGPEVDLYGDMLLGMGYGNVADASDYQKDKYINNDAGNAILRTATSKTQNPNVVERYYFQFLYETGAAIDKVANSTEIGHDDSDFGTFLLNADEERLAIDPPYMGSPFQVYTNELGNHNYACFGAPAYAVLGIPEVKSNSNADLQLRYQQFYYQPPLATEVGTIERNLKVYNTHGNVYYMLNDYFTGVGHLNNVSIGLNGNGSETESTFLRTTQTNLSTPDNSGRVYRWKHPCTARNTWGLLAHNALLDAGSALINQTTTGTEHATSYSVNSGWSMTNGLGTKTEGEKVSSQYGLHTRVVLQQFAPNTIIQTLLMPYKCSENATLPLIARDEQPIYVSTIVHFSTPKDTVVEIPGLSKAPPVLVEDSTHDFHLAALTRTPVTIVNPFGKSGSSAELEDDAKRIFLSLSDFVHERPGACTPSHIAFKQAEIIDGTLLKYDDTVYISSTQAADIYYAYAGKFRYSGIVTTTSSTQVTFFMADMQQYFQMRGVKDDKGSLFSTHNYTAGNDIFKYITVSFQPGTTNFTLELADPCIADCYFPPTDETINSTFAFNIGGVKTLGHDLDVVAPSGFLSISNASRMSICPNFVLVNKDSIILDDSLCREIKRTRSSEYDGVQTTVTNAFYLNGKKDLINRNAIIVNDKAGLVLDSGSYTRVGTLSTLLIRKGGTLIVKKGATLVIGSECEDDRGELIAENGSFVCIEDSSDIHFYNDIDSLESVLGKDTVDRHIVWISKQPVDPAIAGMNELGGNGKFKIGGYWFDNSCLQFCQWKYVNLPYGANNREFGWCNVSFPRATFTVNSDTLCKGNYIIMNAEKTLNETSFVIEVCSYDTSTNSCISLLMDSSGVTNDSIRLTDGILLFKPATPGHYRVRLIAKNDCNERDTLDKIIYVVPDPFVSFSLNDTVICPGYGTLTANGSSSYSGLALCRHEWGITRLFDSTYLDDAFTQMDWVKDSVTAVDSSFKFPGYKFTGGFAYLISLTVKGRCRSFTFYDTVYVPLKVLINIDSTISYSVVGPAPVRLIGTVTGATSWNWSPTTNLSPSNALTTTATPTTTTKYVLTGISATCTARDTVTIRKNRYSYAGTDTSICYNKCIVLGTDFNAAVFLGYINYSSSGALASLYASYPNLRFDRSFTGFMIKNLASYGGTPLIATFMGIDSTRKLIMSRPWFSNYYASFVNSQASISTLNTFVSEVNTDGTVKTKLDAVGTKPKWNSTAINTIFNAYRTYYNAGQWNNMVAQWYKRSETDTAWTNAGASMYFNLRVCHPNDSTYHLFTADQVLNIIESDYVTVKEDSIVVPYFDIAYQTDSTIYFGNHTEPDKGWNKYIWNFGDGSPVSTSKYPIHTFPAFDSTYYVCLSVTTVCGHSIYCDSVRVDSSMLAYSFGKRGDYTVPKGQPAQQQDVLRQQLQSSEHYLAVNVPNPFSEKTSIAYAIQGEYKKAEIRITNPLGQLVRTYDLRHDKGSLIIDGAQLKRGMYYYTLIIDGTVYASKAMVVER